MTDTELVAAWLQTHTPKNGRRPCTHKRQKRDKYYCCLACKVEVNTRFYHAHRSLHDMNGDKEID